MSVSCVYTLSEKCRYPVSVRQTMLREAIWPGGKALYYRLVSERTWVQSRRDEEEGVELDSHEELDTSAGPGEIKRREVVLDPQVSPEEIKSREVELGLKVGLFVCALAASQQQCYGHCLCDSVPHNSWDSNCVVH